MYGYKNEDLKETTRLKLLFELSNIFYNSVPLKSVGEMLLQHCVAN